MQKIAFAKPAQAAVPTGQEIQQALMAQSAPALKKIITEGQTALGLDSSWAPPKTNDKEELISHISEMCNEHGGVINSVKPLQISKRTANQTSAMQKIAFSKPAQASPALSLTSRPVEELISKFEKKMDLKRGVDVEWIKAFQVGLTIYASCVSYDNIEGEWFPCVVKEDLTFKNGNGSPTKEEAIKEGEKLSARYSTSSSYEKDLDESKPILVSGVKGMKSTPFTKKFKNWAAYEKWLETDDAGNYSIEQVRNASASDTVAFEAEAASDLPPLLLEAQKNLNQASSSVAQYSASGRDEAVCKKILASIDKAQKDLAAALREYQNS